MRTLLVISLAFMIEVAYSQVWIAPGPGPADWNVGANWSTGVPPAAGVAAIFTAASNVDCILTSDVVISNMIMSGYMGKIDLQGFDITIQPPPAANSTFSSGSIINSSAGLGFINVTSSANLTFNGTTIGTNVDVVANLTTANGIFTGGAGTTFGGTVNITAVSILLNGSTYNSSATFVKTGAPAVNSIGTGGNTFWGTTSISNFQNTIFATGNNAGDTFNGELRLSLQGSAPSNQILVACGAGFHTTFNNHIKVSTANTSTISSFSMMLALVVNGQIAIGVNTVGGNGGTSTLTSGFTINELVPNSTPVVANEFIYGDLVLRNLTQSGNTAQTIDLRIPPASPSVSRLRLIITNCVFNGPVNFTASNSFVTNSTFNNSFTFHKQRGGGSELSWPYPTYNFNSWDGGNVYNDDANFFSWNNSTWVMGRLSPDKFVGDVSLFSDQSTSHYRIAEGPGTNEFQGNIDISRSNNTSEVKIDFGKGGGTAHFNGAALQTVNFDRAHTVYVLRFGNLHLKNSNGLQFEIPATITSNLNLQFGVLQVPDSLTFKDDATVTGASDLSYVDATVFKVGDDKFTFPIGTNGGYHPIHMTNPASTASIFSARYTLGNHGFGASADGGIVKVSDCEYWTFNRVAGLDNVSVGLSWNDASYCNASYIQSGFETDLRVVGWSGVTDWNNLGPVTTNIGPFPDNTEGYIVTNNPLPASYPRTLTFGSLTANNMLPIRLLFFEAELGTHGAELSWQTASEQNNDFFTIERMEAGQFISLATISGAGTTNLPSNYHWTDTQPLPGISYYRLKQTDFDGTETYSDVVAFRWETEQAPYPNPVKTTLYLDALKVEEEAQFIVKDMPGRTLYSGRLTHAIDLTDFASGMYHVGIRTTDGTRWFSIRKE